MGQVSLLLLLVFALFEIIQPLESILVVIACSLCHFVPTLVARHYVNHHIADRMYACTHSQT